MLVFGEKRYKELCYTLMIPGVWIGARRYWFLPIYKVQIKYYGAD